MKQTRKRWTQDQQSLLWVNYALMPLDELSQMTGHPIGSLCGKASSLGLKRSKPSSDIRFWKYVDKNGPLAESLGTKCWNWTGGKNWQGYGNYSLNKTSIGTHRFSWILHFGQPNEDKPHVLHRCDNPPCVNPDHLFVGTNADNIRDRNSKGRMRWVRGEEHPKSKLKNSDIPKIKALRESGGYGVREIALMFNVSHSLISCITRGKKRKDV